MQMRFGVHDEAAFETRCDELGRRFARWLDEGDQQVPGDPNDADLLMDWKFGYGDGALDRWTLADVEEFLFRWCPRTLSVAGEDCAEVPWSLAAFVEFLDDAGLLAGGSARPADVRHFCEGRVAAFVEAMNTPADTAQESGSGALDLPLDGEPRAVGPVRLPGAAERLATIRTSDALRQLRALAEHCPPPGRQLTAKGNLRVADARFLVDALETGDDPEQDGFGPIRSANDLPALSHLVRIALAAGVVRRHRGRLVAVSRFAALDEVTAHERVVRGAVEVGLSGLPFSPGDMGEVRVGVEVCLPVLLAELLDAGTGGADVEALAGMTTHLVTGTPAQIDEVLLGMVPFWVQRQLETLAGLGVVTLDDAGAECGGCGETHRRAALTAAGVPIAVDLVREADIPALVRSDPAAASAAELADLIGKIEPNEWNAGAQAWLAVQTEATAAVTELVAEISAEHRDPLVVLLGLSAAVEVAGEQAIPAIRARQGGPHDGVILHWLLDRGAVDPATVDPDRIITTWIDVLAAGLDVTGPEEMVAGLANEQAALSQMLDRLWKLDHPRMAEVLEAIGGHHPDKAVAKAARRALMKHRSR